MKANVVFYLSFLAFASAQSVNPPDDFDGIVNGALDLIQESSALSKQNPAQLNNFVRRDDESVSSEIGNRPRPSRRPESFSEMGTSMDKPKVEPVDNGSESGAALESPGRQNSATGQTRGGSNDGGRTRYTSPRNRYNRYRNNRNRPSRNRQYDSNRGQRYNHGYRGNTRYSQSASSDEDCDEVNVKNFDKRWSGMGGRSPWVKNVKSNLDKNKKSDKREASALEKRDYTEKRWSGMGGKSPWIKHVKSNLDKNSNPNNKRWIAVVGPRR